MLAPSPAGKEPILAIAADLPSEHEALALAQKFSGLPVWIKVGLELYTASGPSVVRLLTQQGFGVFLDLKFHDIPNTVRGAVRSSALAGVRMLTLHACGGEAMCRAALAGRDDAGSSALLVGVTVLTSDGGDEAQIRKEVVKRALMAKNCGLDGVVCSGRELAAVKQACGQDFLCVCPGIRFANADTHDQARVCTPESVAAEGADVLVMGRPIVQAEDSRAAAKRVLAAIACAS